MEGTTLMDRQEAGYSVALVLGASHADPCVFVRITTGDHVQEAAVPAGEALDAFYHPALYVDGLCGCARCSDAAQDLLAEALALEAEPC